MRTTWKAGLVIGAAVLATLAVGVVQIRADKSVPDLTGTWTLDAGKSDSPARGQVRRWRGRGGDLGQRTWEGRGGDEHSGRSRAGGNGFRRRAVPRLPRILHITQRPNAILFADSSGVAFQEIHIGAAAAPGEGMQDRNDEVRRLSGHWKNGTLEVERVSPRGGVMLQKFKLEDQGRTLEVRLERKNANGSPPERPGRGPRGGFTMVYRRTA